MCIITADQKDYLLNIYSFVFTIIQFVLQLVVLFALKNYIVYLVVQILCSFANNVFSSRKAVQHYPFIINKENNYSGLQFKLNIVKSNMRCNIYEIQR